MTVSDNRLVLIDGYAQIYRAFFAIRNLTDSAGNPTNAVYGVARFLMSLDRAFPHRYGAFVLDKGRPAERMTILPDYKANRPSMPDDLRQQIAPIREWVDASGIPILEREGFEADDLIAGLVDRSNLGLPIMIVSHDKDLGQLVSDPDVCMVTPAKGGTFAHLDEAEVEKKFGVPPHLVRDWLALVGDSSDNIPGVPGVGAKTASKLLRHFGSIQSLLERLGEVKRDKVRESLEASRRRLTDNIKLVSLTPSLPTHWEGLATVTRRPPDWDRLMDLAGSLNFKSLRKALEDERDKYRNPTLF